MALVQVYPTSSPRGKKRGFFSCENILPFEKNRKRTVLFSVKKERYRGDSYHIQCVSCGKKFGEKEETVTTCLDCGSALEVIMNLETITTQMNRFALEHTPLAAAKYLDFYPIHDRSKVITLSEGNTPLYRAERLGKLLGFSQLS